MWFWFGDPLYLAVMIFGLTVTGLATLWVKTTYARWSQVPTARRLTGAEVAHEILRRNGIFDVRIEMARGWLTDHYDPRTRTLRLSPEVARGVSVAAAGIAAHEVGHAIQHATRYPALALRSGLVAWASMSHIALYMILFGWFLRNQGLMTIGLVAFAGYVLFSLVTLPVEINASVRATRHLEAAGVLLPEELAGARKVLMAAAMTYVAAALTAIVQFLYFFFLRSRD